MSTKPTRKRTKSRSPENLSTASGRKKLSTGSVRERSKSRKPDVGEYLASGTYGIVTQTQTSVFKILMNFRGYDNDENKQNFEREISITKLLHLSEEKSPYPNPFVAIKNVYKDVQIDLTTFKDKLDEDQQTNFDTKSPVYMYEMDNAGMPILDFLESQHKSVCNCDNKLKCDIYTNLEIKFIIKLAELLDYLQEKYKFVHGDLSYNNVMVDQSYHLVLIDIGNAYMEKDGKGYTCEMCSYGARRFNDRRDLFTFLTSLMNSTNFSKKLTNFIEYLPSRIDKQTFSLPSCWECEGLRTDKCVGRHKIRWDDKKIANDTEYDYAYEEEGLLHRPKKCLLFTPKKVNELFAGKTIDNKHDSCKLAEQQILGEKIENYKKKVSEAIQNKAKKMMGDETIETIQSVCEQEINAWYSGLFIPEEVKEEMKKLCKEKLAAAKEQNRCAVMFNPSKKTPKKTSKKTPKKDA